MGSSPSINCAKRTKWRKIKWDLYYIDRWQQRRQQQHTYFLRRSWTHIHTRLAVDYYYCYFPVNSISNNFRISFVGWTRCRSFKQISSAVRGDLILLFFSLIILLRVHWLRVARCVLWIHAAQSYNSLLLLLVAPSRRKTTELNTLTHTHVRRYNALSYHMA